MARAQGCGTVVRAGAAIWPIAGLARSMTVARDVLLLARQRIGSSHRARCSRHDASLLPAARTKDPRHPSNVAGPGPLIAGVAHRTDKPGSSALSGVWTSSGEAHDTTTITTTQTQRRRDADPVERPSFRRLSLQSESGSLPHALRDVHPLFVTSLALVLSALLLFSYIRQTIQQSSSRIQSLRALAKYSRSVDQQPARARASLRLSRCARLPSMRSPVNVC